MIKKDREITSLKEIEEVIQKALVCRLGMTDGNEPYIVPMNFGYKDKTLYFHTGVAGRKIDLIKRNNRVCFEVETDVEAVSAETACKWNMRYRSVIGTGKAYILDEETAKAEGLKVVVSHYMKNEFSIPHDILGEVAVIKIEIETMSGKRSKPF